MFYSVNIDPTVLGGTAPANGFIDPTPVEYHRARLTYTGTVANPTLVADSQIYVRDVPVVVTGTTLASLVLDINDKSYYHHVYAEAVETNTKLQLVMLPGYEHYIPTILDISGDTVANVGFENPVVGATPSQPSTLAVSEAKERGNIRWQMMLQQLQLTGNLDYRVTNIAGADVENAPTEVEFIIDIDEKYYNYDLTGNVVYGTLAIKSAIAKTLLFSVKKMRDLYDPETGNFAPGRPVAQTVREIEVGALTSDEQDAIDSVTVTPIQVIT